MALLLNGREHRVAVLWAFDFAGKSVRRLEERYPGEERPGRALQAARDRAAAKVKIPLAQRAILDCHGNRRWAISCLRRPIFAADDTISGLDGRQAAEKLSVLCDAANSCGAGCL